MSKLGLIIEREYTARVYKRSFILLTLLTPLLMGLVAFVPLLLSSINGSEDKEVAVIDRTGLYTDVWQSSDGYRFVPVDDSNAAVSPHDYFTNKGKGLYAILIVDGNLLQNPKALSLYSEKTVSPGLESLITSQINKYLTQQKIASYDIPELKQIIADADVHVKLQTIKWGEAGREESSSTSMAVVVGMISTFLIYMFIFAYGGMVMQGALQEKTNRIVEVIVSSVKPFELMMGKIIGVGLVGLTQFLIWGAIMLGITFAFGIGATLGGSLTEVGQVAEEAAGDPDALANIMGELSTVNLPLILGVFILYFVGGYLLYASVFATIGSLVDQEADTQQFMIPVTIVILFAFYSAIYSIENPEGPLAFWCSLIPFFSPIVMMVRMPFGVPTLELVGSLLLLYASAIGMTFVSGKIYRTGILMYGKKPSLRDIWKMLRY
jgi:ABC-2 type transport system permease protein